MKLLNLILYAEGDYSGSTYEENRWIKYESYEKIKDDLPEEICCGDLDGKHSEVYGDIEIQDEFENDEDLREAGVGDCDGDKLRYKLIDIYENHNLNFEAEEEEIEQFLETLDGYVEVTVDIPLSQRDELYKYVEILKKKKD